MIQYLKLGSLTRIRTGKLDANAADDNGKYPFFTCSKEPLSINTCSYDCECVLVAGNGDLNVKYYDGKFDAYQRTYIIESLDKTKLMVKYLYCFLDLYVEILRQQAIGGVIKYIKLGNLADAIIPVPVIEKQREIIEIFEKCNGTIAYRHQELLLMDQLVKSRFIEMFGTLSSNEQNFEVLTIESLCSLIKDGTHQTPTYTEDTINGFKFLSSKDIMSTKIDWSDIKYIPSDLHEKLYAVVKPIKNDILMSKNGVNYGVAAVNDTDEVFDIYVSLALLRPKTDIINPVYFRSAINSPDTKRQFDSSIKGIGVPNLHLGEIKKTKILVPPVDKQNEYVSFVEQVDKSKFVERFPELSLFFKAYSLLDSEMICIFPYFCPYAESAREIREIFS